MSTRPVGTWFLAVAGAAVLASVVAAIAVIGSPAHQREQRFDERRERELAEIDASISLYANSERHLPARLEELVRSPGGAGLAFKDPQSGQPYGYRVLDARRYELCAVFGTVREAGGAAGPYMDADWAHPKGRHCFVRQVPKRDAADAAVSAAATATATAAPGPVD